MATKLIVMAGFFVAFAAGLVSGWQSLPAVVSHAVAIAPTTNPTTRPVMRRGGPGGPTRELNLSAEQQEQLNQIWSALGERDRREQDERRQARTDRDAHLMALIPAESHDKYEQIKKDFEDQMTARDQQWRSAYDTAVERTKKILNPDQRARYEQILSRNQNGRGRGQGPDRGRGGERGFGERGFGEGGFGGQRGRGPGRENRPREQRNDSDTLRRTDNSATQPAPAIK